MLTYKAIKKCTIFGKTYQIDQEIEEELCADLIKYLEETDTIALKVDYLKQNVGLLLDSSCDVNIDIID